MSEVILEKLGEMNGKLDVLLQWKAVHQESHKTIDRDLIEVRDTLFENPGLKSQVQTLMNGNRNISRWRNFWMDVLKLTIVAVVVAVLGGAMMLYRKGGSPDETKLQLLQDETTITNQTEKEGELK